MRYGFNYYSTGFNGGDVPYLKNLSDHFSVHTICYITFLLKVLPKFKLFAQPPFPWNLQIYLQPIFSNQYNIT